MNRDEEKLLRMLFYENGGRYFEVIDDGIRKPAIETYLADVEKPTKKHGFDKEIWKVKISWRLLAKWFSDEDMGASEQIYEKAQDAMKRLSDKNYRYANQDCVYDDLRTVQELIDEFESGKWYWKNKEVKHED